MEIVSNRAVGTDAVIIAMRCFGFNAMKAQKSHK